MNKIDRNAEIKLGAAFAVGGATGATVGLLGAKSVIAGGLATHTIPIVGLISGVALMVLGVFLSLHAWYKGRGEKNLLDKKIELMPFPVTSYPWNEPVIPQKPEKRAEIYEDFTIEELNAIEAGLQEQDLKADIVETPKASPKPEPLVLSNADKMLAGSNLVRWGLIGAGFCGVSPTIIFPITVLSSFGSELAIFCSLPKDASWLRKAMSIPILSRALINYNPWIANLSQLSSLYNLTQNSGPKLYSAWNRFKTDPVNALKNGAVHLFNLASGVTFAANNAGLISLKAARQPDSSERLMTEGLNGKTCAPKAKANLPCGNCGMFATALYLLGVMDRYEKGEHSGVRVDFGKDGLYYDKAKGANWFEYYFCPVKVSDDQCPSAPEREFTDHELGDHSSYAEGVYGYSGLSPTRTKELVDKYLVLKPEIQGEIDEFKKNNFSDSDYIVGVHYRGTDKTCNSDRCEARKVTYDEMISKIEDQVHRLPAENQEKLKIFAASDEQGFIERLVRAFPGRVVASPSRKSTDGKPLHFNAASPYQTGKEALMDCWLLGKLSNTLVRTSSNLSKFASLLLRDGAKVVEVSKRFYQDPSKAV